MDQLMLSVERSTLEKLEKIAKATEERGKRQQELRCRDDDCFMGISFPVTLSEAANKIIDKYADDMVASLEESLMNPNGRFPVCMPEIWTMRCKRCGQEIQHPMRTCPAVPPELRWGPDREEQEGDTSHDRVDPARIR